MNLIGQTKILMDYGRYETFSKFYNSSKNLAVDEIIISFKGRVIFKQHIPKKCKHFGNKIFKLCDSTGYM
jgi:hypothetical protein